MDPGTHGSLVYNAVVSQMPPPFSPPAPVKKGNNTALILVVVFVAFSLVCVVPGYFIYKAVSSGFQQVLPVAECAMAFEDLRTAVLDYAEEHEGTLPDAATWQDDVRPYYKKVVSKADGERGPFKPMDPDMIWGCRVGDGKRTGIAFNVALSGKKLDAIQAPSDTVLIFEIEESKPNAHEEFRKLDPKTAPTIFGERRDWMVAHVKGDMDMNMGKGTRGQIKIETSADPEKPAAEPK